MRGAKRALFAVIVALAVLLARAERRAARAEAWADAVAEEAELHLAEMSDSFRRAPAAEKRQAPETDSSAMEVEP